MLDDALHHSGRTFNPGAVGRCPNPNILVGCLISSGNRILLCRRATAPRIGSWTPPAGFLERNESFESGMRREVREESGVELGVVAPYALFDVAHMGELYVIFHGEIRNSFVQFGPEMSDARLFRPEEIPWGQIFYPGIRSLLQLYVDECGSGQFGVHVGSAEPDGRVPAFETGRPVQIPDPNAACILAGQSGMQYPATSTSHGQRCVNE